MLRFIYVCYYFLTMCIYIVNCYADEYLTCSINDVQNWYCHRLFTESFLKDFFWPKTAFIAICGAILYYEKKLNSIISGEERICVEKNIVSLFLHVKPSYGPWCSKVKISNWYNFEVVFIIKENFHILFLVHIFVVTCKSLKHCVSVFEIFRIGF